MKTRATATRRSPARGLSRLVGTPLASFRLKADSAGASRLSSSRSRLNASAVNRTGQRTVGGADGLAYVGRKLAPDSGRRGDLRTGGRAERLARRCDIRNLNGCGWAGGYFVGSFKHDTQKRRRFREFVWHLPENTLGLNSAFVAIQPPIFFQFHRREACRC